MSRQSGGGPAALASFREGWEERMDLTYRGKAEVTKEGHVIVTVRYTVHIDVSVRVTVEVQDVELLKKKTTRGARILKQPRMPQDLVVTGPQDPKLLMVLEDGTRVEFWVVSSDGEISSGRVVESQ